ncbi:MAG: hypothetical protein JO247_20695 [Chloroflexi bacterium]|nr:hypothetical protein [Chloroflexota bacterium]
MTASKLARGNGSHRQIVSVLGDGKAQLPTLRELFEGEWLEERQSVARAVAQGVVEARLACAADSARGQTG